MSLVDDLLTAEEESSIVQVIIEAEKNTSGEIRVHIEKYNKETTPMQRAKELFLSLEIHKTELKNGVLFYVDVQHKSFVILGDAGINKVVETNFWNSTKDIVLNFFKENKFCLGLCEGIKEAGEQLKAHFPYNHNTDINELPDEISKG